MYSKEINIKQPSAHDNTLNTVKRYNAGSKRSQERLQDLNYDPIGELVKKYYEIEERIKIEKKYESGELVKISRATQKEMNWYPDHLYKLLEQQIAIAEKLLRYGYGRVPEMAITAPTSLPPLIVQTTKQGEIYHTTGEVDEDPLSS